MALNGITVHALVHELSTKLTGGRIQKISQPEDKGLLLTVHTDHGQERLYISVNASLPLLYLTKDNKPSPMTAPNFLMVLRKYIGNARIISVSQMGGLERVVMMELEHLDELKDVARKRLYIEIMGKYSNIIFTDDKDKIIDAIKHVGSTQSSVRQVLPGRDYFIPAQSDRLDAFNLSHDDFFNKVLARKGSAGKVLSSAFVGFSSISGRELLNRLELDSNVPLDILHESEKEALWNEFDGLINDMKAHNYSPVILYDDFGSPLEFSPFNLSLFPGNRRVEDASISNIIRLFYENKNTRNLMKQKGAELQKTVNIHMERANKKLALQKKQLEDTKKADKLRLFGELLMTYGHGIKPGSTSCEVDNYYDNTRVTIPLDPTLNGIDNSKKYFEKYDKQKRTKDALMPQLENTLREIEILTSINTALELTESEADIADLKRELSDHGFIKKRSQGKGKNEKKNPPLHFVTEDGFELYCGKNNYQNEEVTFKLAKGNDWWFHAKKMPGSHVILKNDGRKIPDHVFEIAANLAAYYSAGRGSGHVEIDYLQKKDVKRPNGAAPGFVIYYTNYSMMAVPDISRLSAAK